jgi:hypothetical protein
VEERGSVYLPQVNAFYVREFKMMYAAEEAARFLHHACRGLPALGDGKAAVAGGSGHFYARTIEYALGYFGSRVLYPARTESADIGSREFAEDALESEHKRTEASAQLLGYMLGNALYEAYLKGRVTRAMLRRLFLTHLEQPTKAKEAYREIAAKVRGLGKKLPTSVKLDK